MRLQIAARLEHCNKDEIVDQGAKKFDQHDGMLTEHGGDIEELKASNQVKDQRLNNQDQLIAKQSDELDLLKRADQAKDRELREQKAMLTKQEAMLTEQGKELTTQSATIQTLIERLNAFESLGLAQVG